MMHRHLFEGLSLTLQDLHNDRRLFGGITVLLSGDFRQVLPVISQGTPALVNDACLTNASFWPEVKRLSLVLNIRLQRPGLTPHQRADARDFASWLLDVGDGTAGTSDEVKIPHRQRVRTVPDLIDVIYGAMNNSRSAKDSVKFF